MATHTMGTLRTGVANFFGGLGYLLLMFLWLLVVLAYFSWIITWPVFERHSTPLPVIPAPVATGEGSLGLLIGGIVITIVMVGISIYAFIKLPSAIVKTGKRVVHKSAEFSAPTALHVQRKKNTLKNRLKITPKIVVVMKLVLILLALAFMFGSQLLPVQKLDFIVTLTIGLWLGGLTIGTFAFQYILAKLLRVDIQRLW